MSVYGYCPICFSDVVCRTRGGPNAKDTCKKGHTFPSRESLDTEELRNSLKAEIAKLNDRLENLENKLKEIGVF